GRSGGLSASRRPYLPTWAGSLVGQRRRRVIPNLPSAPPPPVSPFGTNSAHWEPETFRSLRSTVPSPNGCAHHRLSHPGGPGDHLFWLARSRSKAEGCGGSARTGRISSAA